MEKSVSLIGPFQVKPDSAFGATAADRIAQAHERAPAERIGVRRLHLELRPPERLGSPDPSRSAP